MVWVENKEIGHHHCLRKVFWRVKKKVMGLEIVYSAFFLFSIFFSVFCQAKKNKQALRGHTINILLDVLLDLLLWDIYIKYICVCNHMEYFIIL